MTTRNPLETHPQPIHSHGSAPPAASRGRWVDNLAVAWWSAGAAFAVVDAVAYGVSGGAAAVQPAVVDRGLLAGVPASYLTLGIAVFAVIGAALAAWERWRLGATRAARGTVVGVAVLLLATAALLVDATVLAGLGYLPAMLAAATFNAEAREALGYYGSHEFLFQSAILVGAVLLAAATVRFARRSVSACETCGRRHDGHDPEWTTPESAARWGRVAALVAASVPAFYAVTRLAWALGIPLGFPADLVAQFRGINLIGPIGLGSFALLGAILTLGLFQRWGERFPRWMLGLAGRRVPVKLAVVPATIVAVAVMPAGLSLFSAALGDGPLAITSDTWGGTVPGLLWPLWSVALGAATYAYWLRRRGRCGACGQG